MTSKEVEVVMKPLKLSTFNVEIEGITPLLMHKFSDFAKQKMLDKQLGKTRHKEKRDIDAEVEACIYKVGKQIVFPAIAFKNAMVECAPYLSNLDKKLVRGSVQVIGSYVPIKFSRKAVNEAKVRLSGRNGVADIRYRPEFHNWKTTLEIKYNANQIQPQQIIELLNYAGFHIGVGDWTPQHNGQFGMFAVKLNKSK